MLEETIQATLMLFVVLDAPGNAPLFYYFTKHMDYARRRSTIRLSIVIAGIVLLVFALIGDLVLEYLGVTMNDFRVAGGAILFIYAVLGLLGHSAAEEAGGEDIAVVPLAMPLLAGPGSITTVIYIKYAMGVHVALISLAVNLAAAWILLENGEKMLRLVGRRGGIVVSKIFAILLAAFAVAMIREGIAGIISEMT